MKSSVIPFLKSRRESFYTKGTISNKIKIRYTDKSLYLKAFPAIMWSFFMWCLSIGGWLTGIANVTVSVVCPIIVLLLSVAVVSWNFHNILLTIKVKIYKKVFFNILSYGFEVKTKYIIFWHHKKLHLNYVNDISVRILRIWHYKKYPHSQRPQ